MGRPTLVLPHRTKLDQLVTTDYEDIRDHLRSELKKAGRVSISLDAWSSPQKVAYLGVMVYWVNSNFQYQERLIGFVPLGARHGGQEMLDLLLPILEFYGITSKLLAVVTDNASNNATLKGLLDEAMKEMNITWSLEQNSMDCLAHVCNLVAQDFINSIGAEAISDGVIQNLEDDQVDEIVQSTGMSKVVKKIF